MGFCKQIPGGNLSRVARDLNWFPHLIAGWNLPRLDGLKFHLGKTESSNHHLRVSKLNLSIMMKMRYIHSKEAMWEANTFGNLT